MEHLNFYKVVEFCSLPIEVQNSILLSLQDNNLKIEINKLLYFEVDYCELYTPTKADIYFKELNLTNIFIQF